MSLHVELEPGDSIDGYRVERRLGSGTFGTVYECVAPRRLQAPPNISKSKLKRLRQRADNGDEERVAVKVIRRDEHHIEDAVVEAEMLAKLQGPHIAELHRTMRWNKTFVMVMARYGPSLYRIQKARDYRPVREELCVRIVYQLAKALEHMHALGYVHTDLHTDNVLLQDAASAEAGVRLIDFGGCYSLAEASEVSRIIQTRQYRAPEIVLRLPWCEKVDIWSLGCVLLELALGGMAFPAHEPRSHLAMIERACGAFPEHMRVQHHFECGAVKFPCNGMGEDEVEAVCAVRPLKEALADKRAIYALAKRMLRIDPEKRYSAARVREKIEHLAAYHEIDL